MSNIPTKKRGVSLSFLLSLLLVAVTIGFMSYFLFFNGRGADKLNTTTFVQYLHNDQITEVTAYANKENVNVRIDGYYETTIRKTEDEKIPLKKFYIVLEHKLLEGQFDYEIKDKDGNALLLEDFSILNELTTQQLMPSVTDVYQTNWWDQWGPTLIMLGGSVIIVFFLFGRLSNTVGNANNKALEFNKSRAKREKASKIRFADVAGADEEKAEMEEVVSYLKEPKKFSKFGAKLPKGILLVGPPGCGKTLLAKAVAGEAGVPFYSISGSDFVEMFVGVGAGRVRDMFKIAKENAPCLIFIDEIDAVGRQRGAGLGGGNDEREQTLNQLLVEMDGFSDNAGIIVIAATNRDDVLDPALLRAGRFDRKITVTLPDRKGREAIFKVHSRNKQVAADVDFAAISKRTVGFSGADIENIMNEAAILAVRRNKEIITIDEIDEAIDRRVAGPAKSSRSLNENEKKMIAYHEAGHAIIGLFMPHSDKVQKITIIPRGNTGGHVRMTPEEDRFLLTKKELEARIVGYLGGRSSEEIFFDDISTGASNDIEVATHIARMMVCELGMSPLGPIQYERNTGSVFLGRDYTSQQKNFSTETALSIDKEIFKIIDHSHELAKKIILEHKEDLILIANTLLEYEQITAEEIDYLLKYRHLKREIMNKIEKTPEITSPEVKEEVIAPVPFETTEDENGGNE